MMPGVGGALGWVGGALGWVGGEALPGQVRLRRGLFASSVCWLVGYLGINNTVAEFKAFERKPKTTRPLLWDRRARHTETLAGWGGGYLDRSLRS